MVRAWLMLGILSVSPLLAVTTYSEAVNGDLAFEGTLPVLPFDIGVNTVSGTLGITNPSPGIYLSDADSFAFSIPAGSMLSAISVTATDNLGDITGINFMLKTGNFVIPVMANYLEFMLVLSPGTTQFTSVPLGPGTYLITEAGFSYAGDGGVQPSTTSDYIFTLTVTAEGNTVPEPSAAMLLSIGLTSLAFRRLFKLLWPADRRNGPVAAC